MGKPLGHVLKIRKNKKLETEDMECKISGLESKADEVLETENHLGPVCL